MASHLEKICRIKFYVYLQKISVQYILKYHKIGSIKELQQLTQNDINLAAKRVRESWDEIKRLQEMLL